MQNHILWSEIGSGFWELCGTPLPKIVQGCGDTLRGQPYTERGWGDSSGDNPALRGMEGLFRGQHYPERGGGTLQGTTLPWEGWGDSSGDNPTLRGVLQEKALPLDASLACRTSSVWGPCTPSGELSVAVLVWLTELYLWRLHRNFVRGISAVGVSKDFTSPAISQGFIEVFHIYSYVIVGQLWSENSKLINEILHNCCTWNKSHMLWELGRVVLHFVSFLPVALREEETTWRLWSSTLLCWWPL